jgi:uncharacterized protein YndB with AHSA1/START domain
VHPNRPKGDRNPTIEAVTTVTFEESEGKTKLTIHMLFESAATRDALVKHGMYQGWSQSFERLTSLLAKT